MPDRLGAAEIHPVDTVDALDGSGADLRGAADRVHVDRSILAAGLEGLLAHAAFADHSADAEVPDDFPLIGLFAGARRRTRRFADPLIALFHHDRATVIDDLPLQIDRRFHTFVQTVMYGIAPRIETSRDRNRIAYVQRADRRFIGGSGELDGRHTVPSRATLVRCRPCPASHLAVDRPSTCTR